MIDEFQNVFNSSKIDINGLYDIADNKNINKFKRKLTNSQDELSSNSYMSFLSDNYLQSKRITNKEIIIFLIMLEYLKFSIKMNLYSLMNEIIHIAYKQAEIECMNVLALKGSKELLDIVQKNIINQSNHLGWNIEDYTQNEINYNSNQLFKQYVIDLTQGNDVDLESDIYKDIFNRQQRTHLNIKDEKISGGIETYIDFIVNKTIFEVGQEYGIKRYKIIGINDNKQTKMCDSLNGKIFNMNDWNEYERYSDSQKGIVKYKTFGAVVGLNMPPITDNFHYCRSTITYLIN